MRARCVLDEYNVRQLLMYFLIDLNLETRQSIEASLRSSTGNSKHATSPQIAAHPRRTPTTPAFST